MDGGLNKYTRVPVKGFFTYYYTIFAKVLNDFESAWRLLFLAVIMFQSSH